jgi:hypothetical protein
MKRPERRLRKAARRRDSLADAQNGVSQKRSRRAGLKLARIKVAGRYLNAGAICVRAAPANAAFWFRCSVGFPQTVA